MATPNGGYGPPQPQQQLTPQQQQQQQQQQMGAGVNPFGTGGPAMSAGPNNPNAFGMTGNAMGAPPQPQPVPPTQQPIMQQQQPAPPQQHQPMMGQGQPVMYGGQPGAMVPAASQQATQWSVNTSGNAPPAAGAAGPIGQQPMPMQPQQQQPAPVQPQPSTAAAPAPFDPFAAQPQPQPQPVPQQPQQQQQPMMGGNSFPFATPAQPQPVQQQPMGTLVPSGQPQPQTPYAMSTSAPQQMQVQQNPQQMQMQPAPNPFAPQPQQMQLVPQQPQPQPTAMAMVPAQPPQQQPQQQDDEDFFGMFSANAAPAPPPAASENNNPPVPAVVDGNVNDAVSVMSRGSATAAAAGYSSAQKGASGSDGLTSRGKQVYRDDVDPEDKDRALAAAGPSTELTVSAAQANATYAPPPPTSVSSQYGRVIAETTQLPNASALPDREQVLHSGYVLSRISFRTILLKKWKQTFWIQYGPSSVLFFRNSSDYEDWLNNPYLNNSQRSFLVKLQIDFVGDLSKVNVRGYQVTHVRMKAYKKKMLHQFKLERWMDYGPTIAAAFASGDVMEVRDLRRCFIDIMRNCPQDPMLVQQRAWDRAQRYDTQSRDGNVYAASGQHQNGQNGNAAGDIQSYGAKRSPQQQREPRPFQYPDENGRDASTQRGHEAVTGGGESSVRYKMPSEHASSEPVLPSGSASVGYSAAHQHDNDDVSILSGIVSEGVGFDNYTGRSSAPQQQQQEPYQQQLPSIPQQQQYQQQQPQQQPYANYGW